MILKTHIHEFVEKKSWCELENITARYSIAPIYCLMK